MAWPNSWKSVVASSSEMRIGSPGAPRTKLLLLDVIGVTVCAGESFVPAIAVRPGARALAGAGEVIAVEEADI